jgi:hypothetical protein
LLDASTESSAPAELTMPASKRSVEIVDDPVFERRQWIVQRIGWAVMAIVLSLALLGLFGHGPLSATSVSDGALTVQYQRFVHAQASSDIAISGRRLAGELASLSIDRVYFDTVGIDDIQPEPVRTRSTSDALIFDFALSDARELHVSLQASPRSAGSASGTVRLLQGSSESTVHVRQWIYP